MEQWRGRVALVTGASVGIGRGITVSLLRHGLNVAACARRVEAIEEIRTEVTGDGVGQLLAIKCDLTKEEEILAMFDQIKAKFGGVDVCINNAGVLDVRFLEDGATSDWRRILDVNVLALAICTRESLKSMKERGVDDGHIINISSIAGHGVVQNLTFYCGSKHAVRAITEGLRMELAVKGSRIRATTVSPGFVETEIYKGKEDLDETRRVYEHLGVEKKSLQSEDVVASVEHVLSTPPHVQINDVIVVPVGKKQN